MPGHTAVSRALGAAKVMGVLSVFVRAASLVQEISAS